MGTFRSFKVCSDAKERVGCRKQWKATTPIKSLVKLQPWFLSLRWKTYLWQNCSLGFSACSEGPAFGQNTLMMITGLQHFMMKFPQNNEMLATPVVQCYHTLLWIRGSWVRSWPGTMDFSERKIPEYDFLWKGSKARVPCRRFTARKRTSS